MRIFVVDCHSLDRTIEQYFNNCPAWKTDLYHSSKRIKFNWISEKFIFNFHNSQFSKAPSWCFSCDLTTTSVWLNLWQIWRPGDGTWDSWWMACLMSLYKVSSFIFRLKQFFVLIWQTFTGIVSTQLDRRSNSIWDICKFTLCNSQFHTFFFVERSINN